MAPPILRRRRGCRVRRNISPASVLRAAFRPADGARNPASVRAALRPARCSPSAGAAPGCCSAAGADRPCSRFGFASVCRARGSPSAGAVPGCRSAAGGYCWRCCSRTGSLSPVRDSPSAASAPVFRSPAGAAACCRSPAVKRCRCRRRTWNGVSQLPSGGLTVLPRHGAPPSAASADRLPDPDRRRGPAAVLRRISAARREGRPAPKRIGCAFCCRRRPDPGPP